MALIYAKRRVAKRRLGRRLSADGAPAGSFRPGTGRSCGPGVQAERQVFMNALRSSPFLPVASTLHFFILSCCVIGVAGAAIAPSAERHVFMKALRSSPFLSPACLLQSPIFDCCLVMAPLAAMPGA